MAKDKKSNCTYVLPFDEKQHRKNVFCNLGFAASFLIAFFGAGWFNTASSHTAWIVFPFMFLFLPIGYFLVGALMYIGTPLTMNRKTYTSTVEAMLISSRIALIAVAINIVLEVLFIALKRESLKLEIVYLFTLLLLGTAIILFGLFYNKVYVGIEEKTN